MTELRNVEADLAQFRTRVVVAGLAVLFAFGLLAARMVYLQVLRHEDFDAQAESNRTAVLPVVPNRGQILDRHGRVLATNFSAYTLEITPSKVEDLDSTIEALGELVDIQPRDKRRFRKLLEESRRFDSLPIRTRLTDDEVARFTAQRYRFPGVDVRARLIRHYPHGDVASHVIGYIGRINQREKESIEEWPEEDQANYRGTDHIGKLGTEQQYERDAEKNRRQPVRAPEPLEIARDSLSLAGRPCHVFRRPGEPLMRGQVRLHAQPYSFRSGNHRRNPQPQRAVGLR